MCIYLNSCFEWRTTYTRRTIFLFSFNFYGQKQKENCQYEHIPINIKETIIYIYVFERN